MSESQRPRSTEELLADISKLTDKLAQESGNAQRHTTEFLRLNNELEEEQRKNATFLLDKCLPVLTAIVGGIAYVLMEGKAGQGWQAICFRVAGSCLTLVILILLARAWLEPFFVFHFKEQLLAVKFGQKPPTQPWLIRKLVSLEEARILVLLVLLLVGIFLAGVATMLHSK